MPTRKLLPNPAAVLPGEMEMLLAVTANLADHAPKLVYADWLEERDDPRGPYLREYVRALKDKKPPPKTDDLSNGWCETVGALLVQRIHEHHLGKYRDRFLALARPVLELERISPSEEKKLRLGASKLCGQPALPKGTPWPRCKKGPLRFYAQFDLAELRKTVAGAYLPEAGLLSFFAYQNWDADDFGHPLVIFTPPGAKLQRLTPPDDLDATKGPSGPPATFTLGESLDLPVNKDPWEEKLGLTSEDEEEKDEEEEEVDVSEEYWDLLLEQRDIGHVLFGYARPRHICGDPIPGPEWEQLISLRSDYKGLGFGWGDGHEMFWHIRTDDLRAGRFDRTQTESG